MTNRKLNWDIEDSIIHSISQIQGEIDNIDTVISKLISQKNYKKAFEILQSKALAEESLKVFEKSLQPLLIILKKQEEEE